MYDLNDTKCHITDQVHFQEHNTPGLLHEGHRPLGLCLHPLRLLIAGRVRTHPPFDLEVILAEKGRRPSQGSDGEEGTFII